MYEAILIVPALILLLAILVSYQAVARRKSRIEAWKAYGTLAHSLHLSLAEFRPSPYGAPELRGSIQGRAFIVWSTEGASSRVLRTVISVAQRMVLKSRVTIYPRGTNPWTEGSLKGKRFDIAIPETKVAVDLVGQDAHDAEAVKEALDHDDEARQLVGDLLRPDEIDRLSWRTGWFDIAAPGFLANAGLIESSVNLAERFVGRVEAAVVPSRLGNLPESGPRRHRFRSRSFDTGFSLCMLAVAAFLVWAGIFVPSDLGTTGSIFSYLLAVAVGLMGGSRIYASWLGPEERRLLRESKEAKNL